MFMPYLATIFLMGGSVEGEVPTEMPWMWQISQCHLKF